MSHAIARVFVNDVEIGSLPADQYQHILDAARRNRRLYASQTLNIALTLFRLTTKILRSIPFLLFFIAAFIALTYPVGLTGLLTDFEKLKPAEITDVFRLSLFISAGISVFLHMSGISGNRYGYVNKFSQYIHLRISTILESPAVGRMEVIVEETLVHVPVMEVVVHHD